MTENGLRYKLDRVAGFLRRGGAADEGIPALQDLDGVVRRSPVDDDVLDLKRTRRGRVPTGSRLVGTARRALLDILNLREHALERLL